MVPNEHSDEVIVRQVQSGDKEAFGILVERYEEKLRRYGKKFLASEDDRKDLLQDIFLKAYMNIQEFDADRRFSPWLYRIAHNEFVNALKRRKPILVSFFDFDALFPHAIQDDSLENNWSEQELKEAMERCLEKLDLKYREPIILHYYDEMDYKGIADVLQIPISTVGVRLSRGRALLKKYYQELPA